MPEIRWPIEDWDTENIRVSIFASLDYNSLDQYRELWEGASGQIPESVDIRPRDGITRLRGVVDGNTLLISIQEGRIDWHITPVPPRGHSSSPLTLYRVEGAIPILNEALHASLRAIHSVERLAFAPVLLRVVPDRRTGLDQMKRYIPHIDVDTLDGGDFNYRVNRTRPSQVVPYVRINRLASWTIEEGGTISFRVTPSGVPAISEDTPFTIRKLAMDINTTVETSDMPTSEIPGLLYELVGIASEIADKGDIQ